MDIFLYKINQEETYRVSLAYEVDIYYWSKKGVKTKYLGRTRSIGKAFKKMEQSSFDPRGISFQEIKDEWAYIKEESINLLTLLNGKALLWIELISLLKKHGVNYPGSMLQCIIQYLYLNGHVHVMPGITPDKNRIKWKCNRCRSTYSSITKTECHTCEEECAYCENCILIGRSRSCEPFLLFEEEKKKKPLQTPPPTLTLTPAQNKVSEGLTQFIDSTKSHALVWAVTGAGKTEMLIPIIYKVLLSGGKVLWVTPRKDVVMEITPRMRRFFPNYRCISLYGGSEDLWEKGNIVVSTAHQALRYYKSFDCVIVDEVDAFPLYGDKSLEGGIYRATKENGKYLYLTATPLDRWTRIKKVFFSLFVLPVRYHGYPLPVPHLYIERKIRSKGHSRISCVSRFIRDVIENNGQALVFVPRTEDVKKVSTCFFEHGVKEGEMEGVYSQDEDRVEKVRRFREGKINFLVTTTILERGVTVPRCWVLVWNADHPVFDTRSLIQIAGRVGRSLDYQKGEVWFLGIEKTKSQQKAKKSIEWVNQKAKKEGFLKKGSYIQ